MNAEQASPFFEIDPDKRRQGGVRAPPDGRGPQNRIALVGSVFVLPVLQAPLKERRDRIGTIRVRQRLLQTAVVVPYDFFDDCSGSIVGGLELLTALAL